MPLASQLVGPSRPRAGKGKGKGKARAVKEEDLDDDSIIELSGADEEASDDGRREGRGGVHRNHHRAGGNNGERALHSVGTLRAHQLPPQYRTLPEIVLADPEKLRQKSHEIETACNALYHQASALRDSTYNILGQAKPLAGKERSIQYQGLALQAQVEALLILLKDVGIKVKNAS